MFSSHTNIAMETSHPLATESFSHSWLINKRPSFDNSECMVKSNKFFEESQNFNFDIPINKSSVSTNYVHADEIFSNGKILPVYLNRSNIDSFDASTSIPSSNRHNSLGKWRKLSFRIFKKCIGRFLRPLGRRIGFSRKSTRVDDINRKEWEKVLDASPRESPSYDLMDDIESTIYEAVLHCKRSIGMFFAISTFPSYIYINAIIF